MTLRFVLTFYLLSIPFFFSTALAETAEQRGLLVFQQVCSACHGMEHNHYEDMAPLMHSMPALQAWSKQHNATLHSPISSPYASVEAGKAANGGDFPPDLSHISRTVKGGSAYIETMLQSYRVPPPDLSLGPTSYYNPVALTHHHHFHMPPTLHDDILVYPDTTKATTAQMAHDVTAFLRWSDDVHHHDRVLIGSCVVIYLLLMTGLFLTLRCLMWRHPPSS